MRVENQTKLESKKTQVYAQETLIVRITSPGIYNIEFLLNPQKTLKILCISNCELSSAGGATAAGAVAVPG